MINWNETWGTVFTGLIIVFVALILLVLIVWLFGKISSSIAGSAQSRKSAAPAPVKPAAAAAAPAVPAPVVEAGEDMDEIAAVITAALAMVLSEEEGGKSYVVKSIRRVRSEIPAWRSAGLSENLRPF